MSLIIYIPVLLLVSTVGLVMHASYAHCDPLISNTISSGDQVMATCVRAGALRAHVVCVRLGGRAKARQLY